MRAIKRHVLMDMFKRLGLKWGRKANSRIKARFVRSGGSRGSIFIGLNDISLQFYKDMRKTKGGLTGAGRTFQKGFLIKGIPFQRTEGKIEKIEVPMEEPDPFVMAILTRVESYFYKRFEHHLTWLTETRYSA
jgi:hypothetical protein